jgi:hypothetical protein
MMANLPQNRLIFNPSVSRRNRSEPLSIFSAQILISLHVVLCPLSELRGANLITRSFALPGQENILQLPVQNIHLAASSLQLA